MKIIRIIRSKLRDKNKLKKEKWYMDRLNDCNSCPFNSKNNKNRDFKYSFWNFLNLTKNFCTICGCEIEAKASEKLEECSNDKKLWEAIED